MASKYLKDKNDNFIHRKYEVDGSVFFSVWVLKDEEDPNKTVEEFVKDKDWIWYENYFEVKYKSHTLENDGLLVKIKTRAMNQKELRKARK